MSSKKRVTNNLVVIGSAAVIAVYSAGYVRTAAAADQFAELSNERRLVPPETGPHEGDGAGAVATPAPRTADAPAGTAAKPTDNPQSKEMQPVASNVPSATSAAPKADKSDATVPAVTSPAPATSAPLPSGSTSQSKAPAVSANATTAVTTSPTPVTSQSAPATASVPAPVVPAPAVTTPTTTPVTTSSSPTTSPAPVTPPPADVPAKTAAAPAPAPAPEVRAPGAKWKDGGFYGWGTSRHGDIQAYIEIDGGKISYVKIEQCLTQYSCALIGALPKQVLDRQSPEVDSVSGATQSANAFYYAIVQALSKAK